MNHWVIIIKVITEQTAIIPPLWRSLKIPGESKRTFITFFRRLCIKVRKTWDTTKPIPTTSRRAERIPTAGTRHDLRVMSAWEGGEEIHLRMNENSAPSQTNALHENPLQNLVLHASFLFLRGKKFARLLIVFWFPVTGEQHFNTPGN